MLLPTTMSLYLRPPGGTSLVWVLVMAEVVGCAVAYAMIRARARQRSQAGLAREAAVLHAASRVVDAEYRRLRKSSPVVAVYEPGERGKPIVFKVLAACDPVSGRLAFPFWARIGTSGGRDLSLAVLSRRGLRPMRQHAVPLWRNAWRKLTARCMSRNGGCALCGYYMHRTDECPRDN